MSDTIDPGEGWRLVDTNGVVSRVRTDSHPDPELDRLRSENADMRQNLADAEERLAERTATLQRQIDYSISLQKAIEAHRRGERVTGDGCRHCADMLNSDLELTEQRACEVVNQMRRRGRLDVSDESCGWFTPQGPENWQCRPAQPKPVTKPVTLPPDKWPEIEAAIKAAEGSVK